MPLTWDQSFATGSAVIDRQHQTLFAKVSALADAMKQGKGRQEINASLDFLAKYVVQHFGEEERLMEEVDCQVAAANKAAHAQFLARYAELRRRLDAAGAGPSLVLEMYDLLSKWLVAHIKGVDVQLREYVGHAKREIAAAAK